MVGSFLNVVIFRLPARQSVVTPRSRCPKCGRWIPWFENIPVASFLLLGAKCRGCRAPISWRYPAVEALTGGLFVLAAFLATRTGVDGWERWGWLFAACVYLSLLVALSFIDLDHRILPDALTKPGMAVGAALSVVLPDLQGGGGRLPIPVAGEALLSSVAGMVAGYALVWAIARVGERVFRREAMGMGDAKLLAMIGAFTGPKGVAIAAAVGLVLGLVAGLVHESRAREAEFPLGPSLAAGGAVAFLFPGAAEEGIRGFSDSLLSPAWGIGTAVVCAGLLLYIRRRLPKWLFALMFGLLLASVALGAIALRRGGLR